MKLSKMESRLLAAMQASPAKRWTLEELRPFAYNEERDPPAYWRSSLSSVMRMLVLKTSTGLVRVKRRSALGRGNVAEYELDQTQKTAFLSHNKHGRSGSSG